MWLYPSSAAPKQLCFKAAECATPCRHTAYHEAGHALVALRTPGASLIHKATIVPRGHALGMVTQVCLVSVHICDRAPFPVDSGQARYPCCS